MCGFVLLVSPSAPVRQDLLVSMRNTLTHRGPDAGGLWTHESQRLAMGHRRLSIIDKGSQSDQPMISSDGRLVIAFNGEIYNYIELRTELRSMGHSFRTESDTEVLLQAYRAWGSDCLSRLNGMFAFAVFDYRSNEVFLARDRFGEKPLFIGRGHYSTVVVASEMKAILLHPFIDQSTNDDAVEKYARAAWYEDGEDTFFSGIKRLPPAHAALFSINGTLKRQWRYWIPDYDTQIDISTSDAVERFGDLFQRSVNLRLRADVPIGSSLSGGLDSSLIVGMLARQKAGSYFTQNTFSACFPDDPTISENREIDSVVKHTGANSYRVVPQASRLAEESLSMHWHQEEPVLSASIYLQWCVARLARENDTTVLLDGQGADELLGGYQSYFKLRQLDLLDANLSLSAAKETLRFNGRLARAGERYEDSKRRFNTAVAYDIEELKEVRRNRPSVFHYPYTVGVPAAKRGGRLRRTLAEALQYNGLPTLLRYADRNSMAFSREARLPFLDYDLVDFCISLPDSMYIRNGWQKWIMRQAAGDLIPPAIRWRVDKVGYAAPLDVWLRGGLRDWAAERLFDFRLKYVETYDANSVAVLWKEHQAGVANHSWALWRWISLVEWFELRDRGWWRAGRVSSNVAL